MSEHVKLILVLLATSLLTVLLLTTICKFMNAVPLPEVKLEPRMVNIGNRSGVEVENAVTKILGFKLGETPISLNYPNVSREVQEQEVLDVIGRLGTQYLYLFSLDIYAGRSWRMSSQILSERATLHASPNTLLTLRDSLDCVYSGTCSRVCYMLHIEVPMYVLPHIKYACKVRFPEAVDITYYPEPDVIELQHKVWKVYICSQVPNLKPILTLLSDMSLSEYFRKVKILPDVYTRVPPRYVYTLRDIALRVTKNCTNLYCVLYRLTSWIKNRYRYGNVTIPEGVDPIEYLLYKTDRVNCIQANTLLALLLRSIGIPARIAVGFLVDPDVPAQTVRVRQLHAWTEVFIPLPSDYARYYRPLTIRYGDVEGLWIYLDATPGIISTIERELATLSEYRLYQTLPELDATLYMNISTPIVVVRGEKTSVKLYIRHRSPVVLTPLSREGLLVRERIVERTRFYTIYTLTIYALPYVKLGPTTLTLIIRGAKGESKVKLPVIVVARTRFVDVKVSPQFVDYGQTVKISGKLVDDRGEGLPNMHIMVLVSKEKIRRLGEGVHYTLCSAVTDRNGKFEVTCKLPESLRRVFGYGKLWILTCFNGSGYYLPTLLDPVIEVVPYPLRDIACYNSCVCLFQQLGLPICLTSTSVVNLILFFVPLPSFNVRDVRLEATHCGIRVVSVFKDAVRLRVNMLSPDCVIYVRYRGVERSIRVARLSANVTVNKLVRGRVAEVKVHVIVPERLPREIAQFIKSNIYANLHARGAVYDSAVLISSKCDSSGKCGLNISCSLPPGLYLLTVSVRSTVAVAALRGSGSVELPLAIHLVGKRVPVYSIVTLRKVTGNVTDSAILVTGNVQDLYCGDLPLPITVCVNSTCKTVRNMQFNITIPLPTTSRPKVKLMVYMKSPSRYVIPLQNLSNPLILTLSVENKTGADVLTLLVRFLPVIVAVSSLCIACVVAYHYREQLSPLVLKFVRRVSSMLRKPKIGLILATRKSEPQIIIYRVHKFVVKLIFPQIERDLPLVWTVGEPLQVKIEIDRPLPSHMVELRVNNVYRGYGYEHMIVFPTYGEFELSVYIEGERICSAKIRIVDYKVECVKMYNEVIGKLCEKAGVDYKYFTHRQLREILSEKLGIDRRLLDIVTMVFEKARYSPELISREDYVAMYRAVKRLAEMS